MLHLFAPGWGSQAEPAHLTSATCAVRRTSRDVAGILHGCPVLCWATSAYAKLRAGAQARLRPVGVPDLLQPPCGIPHPLSGQTPVRLPTVFPAVAVTHLHERPHSGLEPSGPMYHGCLAYAPVGRSTAPATAAPPRRHFGSSELPLPALDHAPIARAHTVRWSRRRAAKVYPHSPKAGTAGLVGGHERQMRQWP